ncbi:lipopolysaccharide heptosyltransferase II [Vibrio salinus]|uniref:lipopolysaccharide heptosyltransferase II n=1 Tax=Vibrio salinus TaxID=2899784 RepID=UPI001E58A449|nr:lipopolysaccharide heptosyltransferase II [Vibrio salinus]MCE0493758.1 lipopolysaccharide heptosyltransferase II [Vibrio salinus]
MKILIIGPSWVGDMVMSQSLYIKLKRRYPEASIDVLAPQWCKPILERMPQIDNTFEMPIGHGALDLKGRWKLGRQLATNRYTHAYILPNSAKSALIPFFARIPHRIGWKGEMRYGLLNDLRPDKHVFQYMVERYVALASSKVAMLKDVSLNTCPIPSLQVDFELQSSVRQSLSLLQTNEVVGLCPGAEFGPAKRWPDHYYAQVAAHCIDQGKQVWLFGSQKDREVTDKIYQALNEQQKPFCHNLSGRTSLVEAVDLLACCDTVICNDSGLMHIAAAVGCKIIAVYGSTSPKYTPPLSNNVTILNTDIECRPCFKRECPYGHLKCLKQLTPDRVIDSITTK